jgi:hypothetical protein
MVTTNTKNYEKGHLIKVVCALFQPVKEYSVYSKINFSDSNQTEIKTEILESISDGEVL